MPNENAVHHRSRVCRPREIATSNSRSCRREKNAKAGLLTQSHPGGRLRSGRLCPRVGSVGRLVQLRAIQSWPRGFTRASVAKQKRVGLHRFGKSRSVTKIENKIVAVPAGVGFPVEFESIVSGKTHNALIGPGRRENILVLRERK